MSSGDTLIESVEEKISANPDSGAKDAANSNSDITELEEKIIRQIEYYFGDLNLPRDRFLQEEVKKDNGWVPLETMVKFNRLKQLTTDFNIIAVALKKSQSGLVEVNEDGTKIRRSSDKTLKPFTKETQIDLRSRTAYAKGFPLDSRLDQILEFCEKFGKTDQITMRKDRERKFKGSIFVVFQNSNDAKKFIETPDLKYDETILIRYTKDGYWTMKNEERRTQKGQNDNQKENEKIKREENDEQKLRERMTKGALLKISNLPTSTTFDDIRKFFEGFTVSWIDKEKEATEAIVRFDKENGAQVALDAKSVDGKLTINSQEVATKILEGDEELQHWRNLVQVLRERKLYDKKKDKGKGRWGKGRGRGRGRGGRGRSEKKSRKDQEGAENSDEDDHDDANEQNDDANSSFSDDGDDDDGPAEKKVKLDNTNGND